MVCKWKLAELFNLFSDLNPKEEEDNFFNKNKKKGKDFFSKLFENFPGGKGPNKSLLIKSTYVATAILVLYFIFLYGSATKIELEGIDCDSTNGSKLKLKAKGYSDFVIPEDLSWKVHSEQLSNGQESIYRITVNSESGKISFNVSKHNSDKNWIYQISNSCQFSRSVDLTSAQASNSCCCCKSGKSNCCSNCSSGSGTCNCSGSTSNKCACCTFMQLVDRAILNPIDPHRITAASIFLSLLPGLFYMGFVLFLARSAAKGQGIGISGAGGMFGFGGSAGRTTKSKVTFKNVGGIKEEKEELEEIVDYLKNPNKYDAMGARIPKGVMLYGPPGTGKTLLAKAISGEANVPFIEVSGSSFDEMFVGLGAKRVRDLFAKAKKLAPCIIFIDEIDSVAGKRGSKNIGGGGGLADQTINQLLAEMDGFNTSNGIMVIAATNQLEVLDDAILRPGRFDRHIMVGLPDVREREDILKVHAKNKNISSSVIFADIARRTPGFSGAQLENILNEATLLAVREDKKVIDEKHIDEAIDRVIAGPAKKSRKISFNEKKQIAYHEAGHAIVGLYCEGGEVVEKVTIIPRGKAAGYMISTPKETFNYRRDEMLSMVTTTLAGRAAEEVFFGEEKISVGASNDLFKVTNIVRNMVTKFGMSKNLGLTQYEPSEGISNPYRSTYSERYSELIDDEMKEIIFTHYEKAKQIIIENRSEFLLIVETLLLIETIDRNQINFIHEHRTLPDEAVEMKNKLFKEGKNIDIHV